MVLLNERRRALGLAEVARRGGEARAADECARNNLASHALNHCGHEVLYMGSKGNSPEAIMDAWFSSPGHRTALTYASSGNAGAAIVTDSGGTLVAALNIDY